MNRLIAGFISGIVATGPMSVFMLVMNNLLVSDDERSLPPYKITMRAGDKAGLWPKLLDEDERTAVTLVAHFGYGGTAGVIYALIAPLLTLPAALRGILYGLIFYAANYLGLLPTLNLYPGRETDHPNQRLVTIGAHVVWGATLGAVLERLAAFQSDTTHADDHAR